jgi:DNA-directed RNA polymerase subunit K/omega
VKRATRCAATKRARKIAAYESDAVETTAWRAM